MASISPSLGDTLAGARIVLTLSSPAAVTGATFGGVEATGIVTIDSTHVSCLAPTLSAGTYGVQCSNAAGASNTLSAAYEAWSPIVDYPAARLYQSDAGITSSSSATRHRVGFQSTDIMAGATYGTYRAPGDPSPGGTIATGGTLACDGQGLVELASGRLLLMGGAPAGHGYQRVNTLWSSDDRGQTWTVLLADGEPSATRPAGAHTIGMFTWSIAGTLYVYWLGGDPTNTPTGDVFRIAAENLDVGGVPTSDWTRLTTTAPTSDRGLFMTGVLDDVIYVMGGQIPGAGLPIDSDATPSAEVYKSEDFGVTWTQLADAPWAPRCAQLGMLPVMNGKLWIICGGEYDEMASPPVLYNDVWSFDGATWTEVLADGHGQFLPRRYLSAVTYEGRLWFFNGSTYDAGGLTFDADNRDAYYSSDGATWTSLASSTTMLWAETHAQAVLATSDGIYFTDGFQSAQLNVIREHTGALVSAWGDQGSANLDVSQGTAGAKPILDLTAFADAPGLALTGSQYLQLSAPDRDLTDGHYEVYFVGKTITFDVGAAQGPNPPATVVGSANGSSWNNAGFDGGSLCYEEYSAGYNSFNFGGSFADDVVRLFGFTHESGAIKAWVGTAQQGATVTTSTFDTSYTGWDSIGAGYLNDDKPAIVLGAVVVLTPGSASSGAFRTKLALWAKKWGSVSG